MRIEWAFMAARSIGVPVFGQLKGVETADVRRLAALPVSPT